MTMVGNQRSSRSNDGVVVLIQLQPAANMGREGVTSDLKCEDKATKVGCRLGLIVTVGVMWGKKQRKKVESVEAGNGIQWRVCSHQRLKEMKDKNK